MSVAITCNGLTVISAKFTIPWIGVWSADLELDLPNVALQPTGPVAIVIGTNAPIVGVVDPRGSGTFAGRAHVRVVGGAGGWDKPVSAKHFHLPAALTSTMVYAETAGEVGELPPIDATPVSFRVDFVRSAGAASRVFGDRDWHVDMTTGAAIVSDWLPAVLDTSATIIDFDPITQAATLTADGIVLPGTILADARFGATTYTVRDVEQVYSRNGVSVTAWCSTNPVSRLQDAFTAAVRQFANTEYLRTYAYRYVLGANSAMALQAITPGAPDLNPIAQWSGLAGTVATLAPSTVVVIGFIGADPTQPFIVAVSPGSQSAPGLPLELDIGGITTMTNLSGGTFFLVPAPWALALATALGTMAASFFTSFTAQATASTGPLSALQSGFTALATASTALTTALAALPPPATTLTKAT